MACNEICQWLDGYLAQELTADEALAVESHVNQCDDCRQELEQMRELWSALEDPNLEHMVMAEPSPLPVDFTAQVMQQIEAEQPKGIHLVWPWLNRRWTRRQYASVAYAMSATLVVVSAGELLFLWNQTTNRLELWGAQFQAYNEAAQAHLGGTAIYLTSFWQWLTGLL